VLVDNEPWEFGGYTDDNQRAMAVAKRQNNVLLALSFRSDRERNADGFLEVIQWDGSKAVCGDAIPLRGSYLWHP
jgi:hypothetical protein